jgi:hypothetical protein
MLVRISPAAQHLDHLLVNSAGVFDRAPSRHAHRAPPPPSAMRNGTAPDGARRMQSPTRTLMPTITSAVGVRTSTASMGFITAQIRALAHHHAGREAEDAGVRPRAVARDAHLRRLDHVLAEAGEVAWPAHCPVSDRCRHAEVRQNSSASMPSEGAAPVDMGVQVR